MQEILSRLDALAAKLGQTAAYLWPHAVRYVVFRSIAVVVLWSFLFLASLSLTGIGFRIGLKSQWEKELGIILATLGGFFVFVCLVPILADGPSIIASIFEPVGFLTREILSK